MMTKQEERNTLTKIEKIIASAGPDSYIGMAFAGCCEIAARNIEYDFADSPAATIAALEKELKVKQDKLHFKEKHCEQLELSVDRLDKERQKLQSQLKEARAKQLSPDLYNLVWQAINSHILQAETQIAECLEYLVHLSTTPKDIAVANTLKRLSEAHARKVEYTEILNQLNAFNQKEG